MWLHLPGMDMAEILLEILMQCVVVVFVVLVFLVVACLPCGHRGVCILR